MLFATPPRFFKAIKSTWLTSDVSWLRAKQILGS